MKKRKKIDRWLMPGLGLVGGGFAKPIIWLLRDEFTVDEAAPMADPRTCTHVGTLDITDTDNKASISSDALQLEPHSTPAIMDPGIWSSSSYARLAGRTLLVKVSQSLGGTISYVGFDTNQSGQPYFGSLVFSSDTKVDIYDNNAVALPDLFSYATSTEYSIAIVLRSAGVYGLIKGGAFTDWTLLGVADIGVQSPLYAALGNYNATLSTDYLRVADLPSPFDEDVLHSRDAGNVALNTTFTHPQRFVLEFDLDTVPSASTILLQFRRQDDNNALVLEMATSTNFKLWKRVDSSYTELAAANGVLANGQRIALVVDGETISGYYDGTHAWTATGVTEFPTLTDGKLFDLGTGGAISDLDVFELGPGVVTYQTTGNVASGTTFDHDAGTRITYTVDTLPDVAGVITNKFRIQDGTHYWYTFVSDVGTIALVEWDAGYNKVGESVGAVSAGDEITLEAIGENVEVSVNGVQVINYSSADLFTTATSGDVAISDAVGAISDLTVTSLARHTPPGIATQSVLGFPVTDQVFTHEPDCVFEFTLNALPSSGTTGVRFRIQDSNNYFMVYTQSSGILGLWDEGSSSTVASEAAAVSGGERIVVVVDGANITVYRDNTQSFTYSSAGYLTETDGLVQLSTGGLISNLIVYPRTLTGKANNVLNQYSA